MNHDLECNIAKLNGYLGGIAAVDGKIRQYSAFAFLLKGGDSSPREQLIQSFGDQAAFVFEFEQKLEAGLAQLERDIQTHLLHIPIGTSAEIDPREIQDRRRLLSFWVCDLIDHASPETRKLNAVWVLQGRASNSKSKCTFFCVKTKEGFLALQFNDDSARVGGQSS